MLPPLLLPGRLPGSLRASAVSALSSGCVFPQPAGLPALMLPVRLPGCCVRLVFHHLPEGVPSAT